MIPALCHFIWLGSDFPYAHVLAVRSAAQRGGFSRVVFHHDSDLSGARYYDALRGIEGVELRPLVPEKVLSGAHLQLYAKLSQPAARANMLRAGLLLREGGVYLDTDTITVASLDGLREESGAFFGVEPVCFPGDLRRSWRLFELGRAYVMTAVRDACRRMPDGPRRFARIEKRYAFAPNNAVVGTEPGHPLVTALLDGMVAMPEKQQLVRYALGTHLLQTVAAERADDPTMKACGPGYFYPLGPEMSEHWFRMPRGVALSEVLRPETRVVHWYASVRTKHIVPQIDAEYVRRNAEQQLFSELALPFV